MKRHEIRRLVSKTDLSFLALVTVSTLKGQLLGRRLPGSSPVDYSRCDWMGEFEDGVDELLIHGALTRVGTRCVAITDAGWKIPVHIGSCPALNMPSFDDAEEMMEHSTDEFIAGITGASIADGAYYECDVVSGSVRRTERFKASRPLSSVGDIGVVRRWLIRTDRGERVAKLRRFVPDPDDGFVSFLDLDPHEANA